jgi:tRNA modification GTPase
MQYNDTIVALATPAGAGAIAVIRLSGEDAISIASSLFVSVSGKNIASQKTHTVHLGHIKDGTRVVDEVLQLFLKTQIAILERM